MSITFTMTESPLGVLEALEAAIVEKTLRPTAHAGAIVLYDEARERAPVYTGPARDDVHPGQLRDAIYRVFSNGKSRPDYQVYEVSWNHSEAPHGYWMEYGNSVHAAKPFMRPAFDSQYGAALDAMRARSVEKLREVVEEVANG